MGHLVCLRPGAKEEWTDKDLGLDILGEFRCVPAVSSCPDRAASEGEKHQQERSIEQMSA